MAAIIRNLPYFGESTSLEVRGRSFSVKRDQIVIWISISEEGEQELALNTPRIPAILDTGCNHNLVINQQQLSAWAGIHPGHLPKLANTRVSGTQVSQLAANAWLHPNVPGKRDEFESGPPFQLELPSGIAVHPAKPDEPLYPRLPLLGLRAFRRARLQVRIDCDRQRVNIYSRRRFWLFG